MRQPLPPQQQSLMRLLVTAAFQATAASGRAHQDLAEVELRFSRFREEMMARECHHLKETAKTAQDDCTAAKNDCLQLQAALKAALALEM